MRLTILEATAIFIGVCAAVLILAAISDWRQRRRVRRWRDSQPVARATVLRIVRDAEDRAGRGDLR